MDIFVFGPSNACYPLKIMEIGFAVCQGHALRVLPTLWFLSMVEIACKLITHHLTSPDVFFMGFHSTI